MIIWAVMIVWKGLLYASISSDPVYETHAHEK